MPEKHPYTPEASKGALLALLDNGDAIVPAAKKAKINIKTARDIKRRADSITTSYEQHNLPPPSFKERTIIMPKSGQRHVLSKLNLS
jgi:dihydroxyacid dehydratase/phosphogluconate dehydratase